MKNLISNGQLAIDNDCCWFKIFVSQAEVLLLSFIGKHDFVIISF